MIFGSYSDLASFKAMTFKKGLNVILADKSEGATDLQSRNGAGKTSFVELVHFIFGADAPRESIFRAEELEDQSFGLSFNLGDQRVLASRSGSRPSKIMLNADVARLNAQARFVDEQGEYETTLDQWREVLGRTFFGIGPKDEAAGHKLSFRSLFTYFARRQSNGGFQEITTHSAKQQPYDAQMCISFLLGLDWTLPARLQAVRDEESLAKKIKGATKNGTLKNLFGKAAELRTRLTVAESKFARMRAELARFEVVPQYKALEEEANQITASLERLNIENIADGQALQQLQKSLNEEAEADELGLERLYAEAGVILPTLVTKRLDEVTEFHRTIVRNRKTHLSAEISSLTERISSRDRLKESADARRRVVMGILQSGGALDQFTKLRDEVGRSESEVSSLRSRLELTEQLEKSRAAINVERAKIAQQLQVDLQERSGIAKRAILVFEELSEALYERAGSLTISNTHAGINFEVQIDGQRSKGIRNMQIFCFDLMLAQLASEAGRGPGFLIHDSHLFDGVDERQVANALQLAEERARKAGFQYIVTLNSDSVPHEGFDEGFNLGDFVVSPVLTDAETGGLFGLRFR